VTAGALDSIADVLAARLGAAVERDAPSAPLTTYRCGGPISVLVRAGTEDDVRAVAAVVAGRADVPVLVVGRGSNLLVADHGFAGVAVVLGSGALDRVEIDRAAGRVDAGAAAALPVVARQSAKAGLTGLEFYVGIPGSVGGAVRMNAGGHGAETAGVLRVARLVDLDDPGAPVREVAAAALGLGYRRSGLGPRQVVVGATFAASADDPAACEQRIDEIVRWRREHQPGGQNAGSVFVNPEGDAAGRLIEDCGLKGTRVGGAVVSEKHANFFVAEPGARADDVIALIELVRARVEAETGVRLATELQIVGRSATQEARP